ncbi:hypothetical protein G7Z17_g2091 [Cylindrodendrum hubeiense]|uniref:G-protein coupled receptors family 2 profile 2 domain-containing protein n=1 Tax=Cylindrodendrum hubeiense TaxID=595255 RepID=A0A9P5LKR3_9HYPO|nr:hypothetical protein G7Z17_g2091 [Cylindrodendrum hubeiense]
MLENPAEASCSIYRNLETPGRLGGGAQCPGVDGWLWVTIGSLGRYGLGGGGEQLVIDVAGLDSNRHSQTLCALTHASASRSPRRWHNSARPRRPVALARVDGYGARRAASPSTSVLQPSAAGIPPLQPVVAARSCHACARASRNTPSLVAVQSSPRPWLLLPPFDPSLSHTRRDLPLQNQTTDTFTPLALASLIPSPDAMQTESLLAERAEALTPTQTQTLVLLERIGGSVSLVAVVMIFVAYALVPRVRNVQNTFIMFASIANIGASVASIIAMDGLNRGVESGLCQGQGFLFQMFMQSDPWWSLAMAFNVFLVFFFRTSPDAFRKWWWLYCLICYGGPFGISLALVLVRHPGRGRVFGQATIWCWVDRDWENVRIYSYYMLIWICIVGSLLFYFLVGYHVFRSRNRLRSFSASKSIDTGNYEQQMPRVELHVPQDCFYGTIVTEVQVVQSKPCKAALPTEPRPAHTQSSTSQASFEESPPSPIQTVPSQYFSTATSPAGAPGRSRRPLRRITKATSKAISKFVVEDPIKRAYLRTSFLFALSVLVTWTPSSMNRIHSWMVGESPYEYHVATAAVLPLQGLWNAVIFFITSTHSLREGIRGTHEARQGSTAETTVDRVVVSPDIHFGRGGSCLDDTESGSDVELRRMTEAPGKRSASM